MDAKSFIDDLGGPTKVAKALAIPFTTVASWRQNNSIPHWRMPKLAELALEKGKAIPVSLGKPEQDAAA